MAVSREQNDHPLVPHGARPGQARSWCYGRAVR